MFTVDLIIMSLSLMVQFTLFVIVMYVLGINTEMARRPGALYALLYRFSLQSLKHCVRQLMWRGTGCWSSLKFNRGGLLKNIDLIILFLFALFCGHTEVSICMMHFFFSSREVEAIQKCADAEQKLRDERHRCVLLEQQLERLKLDSEKAQRVRHSRTGRRCTAFLQDTSEFTRENYSA